MNTAASRWILVSGISAFVFVFLWAFQPFGLYLYFVISPMLASLGYAVITFLLIALYVFGWNRTLVRYYGHRWTIGKHLIAIFSSISLIGIVNGVFAQNILSEEYLAQNALTSIYLMQFAYTHAVGLFPVVLVLLIFEVRERNYYVEQSGQIQSKVIEDAVYAQTAELIEIVGDSASEKVKLLPSDFLFARASGNYVELYYTQNDAVAKEVMRITLSGLLEQLSQNEEWIFQTHRSYAVNLQVVSKVEGNAQGYTLVLHHTEELVPVSRGKIAAFNTVMNSM